MGFMVAHGLYGGPWALWWPMGFMVAHGLYGGP